ncbi:hypothetical protein VTO73DRAFT_6232 [Trametes versicolor]
MRPGIQRILGAFGSVKHWRDKETTVEGWSKVEGKLWLRASVWAAITASQGKAETGSSRLESIHHDHCRTDAQRRDSLSYPSPKLATATT